MRILQVVDVHSWAIGQLARVIEKKNPHLWIKTIAIHPKDYRNNPPFWNDGFLAEVKSFQPDVIHFHYWDVANSLSKVIVETLGEKRPKMILTHHNQKNLLSHKWEYLDHIVCHTKKAQDILVKSGFEKVTIIQHGIDIEKFRFNEEYDPENRMIGYVGRIVPWKHLVEILQSAKNIGTKVIGMGRVDKADYYAEVQKYKECFDERFATPDEKQVQVYHEMAVYVGNSEDDIEEGPLGLIEAMACGIPVITTKAGEASDIIKDRENGIIIEFNNQQNLEIALKAFFAMTPEQKNKMREEGWDTARKMSQEKMATEYEKMYYKIAFEKDLVSVIIPTFNRADTLKLMLEAHLAQTYRPIEVIVCDDNSQDEDATRNMVFDFALEHRDLPIKYVDTGFNGYGLAMARNMGILESSGYYLFFNDDRMVPERLAVEKMIKRLSSLKEKSAVWGDKGAGKRDFIENFFSVRKRHIVDAGMFNERINLYGGQSQELRARLKHQNFTLEYEPEAKAKPSFGTRRNKRRYDIVKSKFILWKLGL